jgi:prefoldin subunit 5
MIELLIINPKTQLTKVVDATKYTIGEIEKTFKVYMEAGYKVYVQRGIEKIMERIQ